MMPAMHTVVLLGSLLLSAVQPSTPVPASEVTLRHEIYRDARVNVYLLDIPPGRATVLHRHDRDILSVFVRGGKTRAVFNGGAPVDDTFAIGDVRFRNAGFTHSTENRDSADFFCVIFEFATSQGPRKAAPGQPTRTCGDGQEICAEEKPLFCTDGFCVDDVVIGPRAVKQDGGEMTDRMLIAVSDYSLRAEGENMPVTTHDGKTGQVELIPAGSARRWTNTTANPAHYVVLTFR